jgi:hypothetical protein
MSKLKKDYIKHIADRVLILEEDLSEIELKIIDESFYLFISKLEDIKILNDEIKRLTIENLNLKEYLKD